ncbi:MAG: alpha-2-macroglobulin family protein [Mucilaginibacter sp.]
MCLLNLKTLHHVILLCLLLVCTASYGQKRYDAISFHIDSLASVGLPASALAEVDKLEQLARKENNAPQQVKAAVYKMTFLSYLKQDALESVISELRTDIAKSTYPVKPVLQSVLAEIYWKYYQQNRYQFSQRSRLVKPDTDFTNWDLNTIINETSRLYKLSLLYAEREQTTPISVLDGVLAGDSSSRYLRPTLYDLLIQRAFEFYLSDEPELTKPKLPFSLNDPTFFNDSRSFAELSVKTTDTSSTWYQGIKLLQQATAFNLKLDRQEALADVDMLRLQFLYSKSSVEDKDSLYLAALQHITTAFAKKPISSEALVMLGQYQVNRDSLTTAHQYFKQAQATYPQSLGGKNASLQLEQLDHKEISAAMESIYSPGKPLLAELGYRNTSSATILIYKLSQAQYNDYFVNAIAPKGMSYARYRLELLKKLKPVQSQDLNWKDKGDYRKHAAEFKLDSLQPGNYALLVKGERSDDEMLESIGSFRVSGMAYVMRGNPDENIQVVVTDRETGEPISGVRVELAGRVYKYINGASQWEDITEKGSTDDHGFFVTKKISGSNVSITLRAENDMLTDGNKYINGSRDNSDADEPNDKTILFTDRQIYRPGQTIYFKALQLQVAKGKSKIEPGKDITVQFMDVNYKEVGSLQLKTNEFGTVSGSFIIPQSMLDGNVRLKTVDGDISVKVEEYKRPTFQVEFLPVKVSLKVNDTVIVKGKVTAFSGYGLSQARVAYHITRNQNYDTRYAQVVYSDRYRYHAETKEIKTDTVTTDGQGNYTIKFKAGRDKDEAYNLVDYRYTINADVTDASGETHSAEKVVVVGYNDIAVRNYLPDQWLAKDSLAAPIWVDNLNGQAQKSEVKVEVYALENPERVYKGRLWPKPDQFLLNSDDFKKDFPEYAYKDQDVVATWTLTRQVYAGTIKTDGEKPGILDLNALRKEPSGMYRVVISARNERGDTVSSIKYIDLVASLPMPSKTADWVIPVHNEVKPCMQAEFMVGLTEQIAVLVERYNGPKLVSSQWEMIEPGQHEFRFAVSDKDKDPAVQFMTIYQDRIYSSYQKIHVVHPDKMLDIKLLTFRNKLQPGEKEQWKLQVTDVKNEKQSAEMVAALYDASLDDLTTAQDWSNVLDDRDQYSPDYFNWENQRLVWVQRTMPVQFDLTNYAIVQRNYEHLDLLGYAYYGGYNSGYQWYLQKVRKHVAGVKLEKQLEVQYLKNAKEIKGGYDVTGTVLALEDGLPIPGATIKIKGKNISTTTNSAGYFKIKVPAHATLLISFVGYDPFLVATTQSENITVKLKSTSDQLGEVVITKALGIKHSSREVGYSSSTGKLKSLNGLIATDGLTDKVAGLGIYSSADSSTMSLDTSLFVRKSPGAVAIRKNFNETAFFYPQLYTDSAGKILIDFTIPEALTKWRFKAFAHTKDLKTGYLENTVVTQKQLSISANMPRFMREGDTIIVSARLANLTSDKLKGNVTLQLYNGLNMQPVSLLANPSEAKQQFEVAALTNKAVSFRLVIPQNLEALTYRLTADAGTFSDGEENTLPVLPNRMLVTESMPMMIRSGQEKIFTFDKLLNNTSTTLKSKSLTLEYTQNPAWYAVQALPYMMEFPYECSEQVFSRYYANSLAINLMNHMPVIKQVFDQWKASNSKELLSNLDKNQELKNTLLEETPWLNSAIDETEQKKRIALLFDLNKMSSEMQLNLDKLQKRQLPDGGFTWFAGEQADRYITQHIVEGIGQLYHLHIPSDGSGQLHVLADKAVGYLDNQVLKDEVKFNKTLGYLGPKSRTLNATEIHAWYARSFYPDQKMSGKLKKVFDNYIARAEKQWLTQNVYEQGMIALTMLRNGKPLVANAIIKSLKETATQTDDMGMYWNKNMLGYFWYESPIETQSLLIGLFTEAGSDKKAIEEMKIWLLRNKQTSDWKTTKATAAACYALLMKQDDWLSPDNTSSIKLGGQELSELKPGIKIDAGTGYIKANWADYQIKTGMGKVQIKNNGKSISWGAMHWQYLEQLDKITPSKTDIQLARKYFILKQTDAGPEVIPVDAQHQPKTGDLLKVIVYLKAGRDFEYVQLKDMRPAGAEPVNVLSAYKYQDGLWYYEVTKDVATNFFISYLSKGNYVFEYQLRVVQPGDFSTGISSIQCMYAPEFNAHSEGGRLTFKP